MNETTSSDHSAIAPAAPLPFPLVPRTGPARLCVVVPIYNEARVLDLLFARLRDVLDKLDVSWSMLFVNDGSADDTVPVLEALAARDARVNYLCLSRNFGHQAALSAGLDEADADVVVTMDGDLQHPPELLPVLVEAWRRGYDVVHTRKLSSEGLPAWRRLATKLAYSAVRRVADVEIIPEASDFRLLDRTALAAITTLPERHRLYRGLAPWVGFRQAVLPYDAHARAEGNSRYGLRQLLQLFGRSFFDFSNAPLHVGVVMGAATILACFAYVGYSVVAYAIGHHAPQGYVTLIFIIVLLSSINLTFSGILGVYLARIYNEVRRRPSYIVGQMRLESVSAIERREQSLVAEDASREDLGQLHSL
jgi:glycosyltransferase involved in cell wall biosynthesis